MFIFLMFLTTGGTRLTCASLQKDMPILPFAVKHLVAGSTPWTPDCQMKWPQGKARKQAVKAAAAQPLTAEEAAAAAVRAAAQRTAPPPPMRLLREGPSLADLPEAWIREVLAQCSLSTQLAVALTCRALGRLVDTVNRASDPGAVASLRDVPLEVVARRRGGGAPTLRLGALLALEKGEREVLPQGAVLQLEALAWHPGCPSASLAGIRARQLLLVANKDLLTKPSTEQEVKKVAGELGDLGRVHVALDCLARSAVGQPVDLSPQLGHLPELGMLGLYIKAGSHHVAPCVEELRPTIALFKGLVLVIHLRAQGVLPLLLSLGPALCGMKPSQLVVLLAFDSLDPSEPGLSLAQTTVLEHMRGALRTVTPWVGAVAVRGGAHEEEEPVVWGPATPSAAPRWLHPTGPMLLELMLTMQGTSLRVDRGGLARQALREAAADVQQLPPCRLAEGDVCTLLERVLREARGRELLQRVRIFCDPGKGSLVVLLAKCLLSEMATLTAEQSSTLDAQGCALMADLAQDLWQGERLASPGLRIGDWTQGPLMTVAVGLSMRAVVWKGHCPLLVAELLRQGFDARLVFNPSKQEMEQPKNIPLLQQVLESARMAVKVRPWGNKGVAYRTNVLKQMDEASNLVASAQPAPAALPLQAADLAEPTGAEAPPPEGGDSDSTSESGSDSDSQDSGANKAEASGQQQFHESMFSMQPETSSPNKRRRFLEEEEEDLGMHTSTHLQYPDMLPASDEPFDFMTFLS